MKSLIAVVAMLSCAASASEATVDSSPKIRVFGTATTEIVPDQLEWLVLIREVGQEVGPLADLHAKNVDSALDFLKTAGTSEGSVQTSDMTLGPNIEYLNGRYETNGYKAETRIAFQTTDFARYKDLWVGILRLPGASIERVGYTSSKRIKVQNDTRIIALEAARTKAEQMAKALGSDIGEPLLIEEEPSYSLYSYAGNENRSNNYQASAPGDSEDGVGIAPGKIPITIRVSVAFRLVNKN